MTALRGVRVVELEAKGPAPFAVMLLADLGADVIRVERPGADSPRPSGSAALERGRRSVALNLKSDGGRALLLRLIEESDVLVEGYRPGVAERLGFGPEVCLERNPRLVYTRMTGWGQDGPLAQRAAHDINFLAVAGALYPIGSADRPPPPPLNLVGDFAGGGAYLVIGVLAALVERERSGRGQVVDAAMVDGVASMLTAFHAMRAHGDWNGRREANLVDGGSPWYRCYATADGGYVAVGALEPQFHRQLIERLGLAPDDWPMNDHDRWSRQRAELQRIFLTHPRAHWEALFDGSDACVTPVLSLEESLEHPHLVARGSFTPLNGGVVPQAAPRLTRTAPTVAPPAPARGEHTDAVLAGLGIAAGAIAELRAAGAIG
jgi:alpha-methylacyl-CoA racemase